MDDQKEKMMSAAWIARLLKLFAVLCVVFMVICAYISALGSMFGLVTAHLSAEEVEGFQHLQQIGRMGVTVCAAMAVVFSWMWSKLDKPWRTLGLGVGIGCGALALAMVSVLYPARLLFAYEATRQRTVSMLLTASMRFLLILALLLAIIWIVSGMIRRNLTERKKS